MVTAATTVEVTVERALRSDAPAWDALVLDQPIPSPFLRSWWLDGATGHNPCLLLVRDGAELLGGLALEQDLRLGVPRLLAAGSALAPDHVDLVAASGREEEVVRALASWLRRPGSRLIDLSCAVESPRLAAALQSILSMEVVESAPWTPLSPDFKAYMAERPSRLRNSLDRTSRRLKKEGGARYHRVQLHELEEALETLRRLHQQVFGDRSLFLPYFDRFAAVARLGVAADELVLHQLRVGDTVIASDVTLEVARRVSYYQSGRDMDHRWRGAGVYLECCILEQACNNGFLEFDHLRGVEEYKRGWAPETRHLTRVIAAHGLLGRPVFAAFEVATSPALVSTVNRVRSARSAVLDGVRGLKRVGS
jgi:CelD/BcsL family acetyltransferase involved in cellulose biosynthesis